MNVPRRILGAKPTIISNIHFRFTHANRVCVSFKKTGKTAPECAVAPAVLPGFLSREDSSPLGRRDARPPFAVVVRRNARSPPRGRREGIPVVL